MDPSRKKVEVLSPEWRSGRDVYTIFPSLSPFRSLDTSPSFESISNDLEYYGETLPSSRQFHSRPFSLPRAFLLVPSIVSERRKLLTQC